MEAIGPSDKTKSNCYSAEEGASNELLEKYQILLAKLGSSGSETIQTIIEQLVDGLVDLIDVRACSDLWCSFP